MSGRGRNPNSLRALAAHRPQTKKTTPRKAAHVNAEFAAKMREAKARKRDARLAMEAQFPIVTKIETVTRDTPGGAVGEGETQAVESPKPRETPAAPIVSPILEPPVTIPEETEGERRARLYKRDYDLLLHTRGGWRELNRLKGLEPTNFPRVHSRLHLEAL